MHQNSYLQMARFVNLYLNSMDKDCIKVLDVGSQDVNGTYKTLFSEPKYDYTGVDMCPGNNVNIVLSDVYNWKEIDEESIDVIICGQVFEHVEYTWNTILEVNRVMKEGAYCCIIAPAVIHEHKYPIDCWRFYSDGFRALAKFAGLKVIETFTDYNSVDPGAIDTVLICQKPTLTSEEKAKLFEKLDLVRKIARDYEINI